MLGHLLGLGSGFMLGLWLLWRLRWFWGLSSLLYLPDWRGHGRGDNMGVRRGRSVRRRDCTLHRRRGGMVRRRHNRGMLGKSGIRLLHRQMVVLHGWRRPAVPGGRIGHVGWAGHGAVLIRLLRHVVGSPVRIGHGAHVARIHGRVVDYGGLLVMIVVVVMVGGRIVLRSASAARSRAPRGHGAHVDTALRLLPSRQMPASVHHAGLGCVALLR